MSVSMKTLVVTLVSMVRAVSTGGFRRMAFRYAADHRGRKSNGVTRITTPRWLLSAVRRVRREEQLQVAASGDGGRGWLMKTDAPQQ